MTLLSTAHIIERVFNARLARQALPINVSGSRLRLLLVVEAAGRLRMGDLAMELGIRPRTVTTLVDALEKEGLLARSSDPDDRRATLLEITPTALAHFTQVRTLQQDMGEELVAPLDAGQRRQLLALLHSLTTERLSKEGSENNEGE